MFPNDIVATLNLGYVAMITAFGALWYSQGRVKCGKEVISAINKLETNYRFIVHQYKAQTSMTSPSQMFRR
jgi:hypothetical protein